MENSIMAFKRIIKRKVTGTKCNAGVPVIFYEGMSKWIPTSSAFANKEDNITDKIVDNPIYHLKNHKAFGNSGFYY